MDSKVDATKVVQHPFRRCDIRDKLNNDSEELTYIKRYVPTEVMKKLTTGFAKVLDQCKTELNVGDHILQDFFNFWREEYELLNRDMGCIVLCMATKLDLISEDLRMHHGNAHEFAKNHGADDELAKQLVTIIHDCETISIGIEDSCNRALEVAKCFRSKMHELKWAPSMEVVLEEVMTSV